jgi:hypothetical protein
MASRSRPPTNTSIKSAWRKALNQPLKPAIKNTTQLELAQLLARFIPELTKKLTPKIEQQFLSEITELKAKNEELETNLADCKSKLKPVQLKPKTLKSRSRHPKFNRSYHTPHVYQTGNYE